MRHLIAMLLVLAAATQTGRSETSCSGWTQVTVPLVGSSDNVLASVSASSATDIWTVGAYAPDSDPNITRTLTQHFDGNSWSVVASPNVGSKANQLYGVSANSGKAWAVGNYFDSTFTSRSLIETWDGTQWTVVAHPAAQASDVLFGVSALSPQDIWAVGFSRDVNGAFETLTEHFDGNAWSVVASPSPGAAGNQLYSVRAFSSSDVWAVGEMVGREGPNGGLIEHWNGSTWSAVPSPTDGLASTLLYSLAGTHGNVIAVGSAQNNIQSPRTLVEVKKNGAFILQNALSVGSGENDLFGVTTLPGSGLEWAVGTTQDAATGSLLTLIERFAGGAWMQQASPSPGLGNGDSLLASVIALSSTNLWAVGTYDGVNAAQPLVLHGCQ